MTPDGRKAWASPLGQSLMKRWMQGEPALPEHRQLIDQLKRGIPGPAPAPVEPASPPQPEPPA